MRKQMRGRTARKGFTLFEILMVIAILAILVMAVVPNLIGAGDKAKVDLTAQKVARSGSLATAINLFRTHTNAYPESLKDLTEKPSDEAKAKNWHGPYIDDPATLKDAWDRDLQYKAPGEHNPSSYDLWSVGPDGNDGTDDDIGNWQKAE